MPPFRTSFSRHVAPIGAVIALICAVIYPSDMDGHYATSRQGQNTDFVTGVEHYGRHVNTIIPIGLAIVLRDVKGLGQITATIIFGSGSVNASKRALNDVEIAGQRLGQRPNGNDRNMPSGHSAAASAGAYIAVRRYSKWLGVIVWPVLIATMYARYMLDAHTVSATIAGAILGIMVAWVCTRPYQRMTARQELNPVPK